MEKGKKIGFEEINETALYLEAENKTNRDNVKCLSILAAIIVLCEVLNETGLFQVVPQVMRAGAIVGTLLYLTPVTVLYTTNYMSKKEDRDTANCKWFKYFIIAFAWLGTIATCITLTHHTIMVMAVPILIMAQYRNTKELVPITVILATLCTFLGVYGGYFWGCFDANLLHIGITDDNAFDLALRAEMATKARMTDLFTHYVIPRELIILALVLLATQISHRSNQMLMRQAKLQWVVEKEMKKSNEMQWKIIDGMANLIENRDTSTGEHVKRTGYYVSSLVNVMKNDIRYSAFFSGDMAETIVKAAPLHDIGKIVVADRILQKPGRLTTEEYEEIKLHASEGANVIMNVLGNVEDDDFLRIAAEISGGHHERWDGKGYPKGLLGEEIPLAARIMAVADVFDALVSERVYKEPIPPEEAFAIIKEEAGKQFDPYVAELFCGLKTQMLDFLNGEDLYIKK